MRDWAKKPFNEWTDEDLLDCVRWWAEELGLGAWHVHARFVTRRDNGGALGSCSWTALYEDATVCIAEWRDRDQADRVENDLEVDCVHELLHIRFWVREVPSDAEDTTSTMYELAIERTARALVDLRRKAEQ